MNLKRSSIKFARHRGITVVAFIMLIWFTSLKRTEWTGSAQAEGRCGRRDGEAGRHTTEVQGRAGGLLHALARAKLR